MLQYTDDLLKTILISDYRGRAMPGSRKAPTLPAMNTGINHQGPKPWTPVYADQSKIGLPIGWQCPCGGGVFTESGMRTCIQCGRVSRDATPNGRLDGYQSMDTGRELKRWKKFSTKRRL